ncbi:MAG TPA: phospholipase A2 [Actinomycetales bacterium]|nr:phospholipase A2 [Actinomycetales bacterium]
MRPLRLVRRAGLPMVGGLLALACVAGWGRPAGLPVADVQQPDAARAVRQITAARSSQPDAAPGPLRTPLAPHAASTSGSGSLAVSAPRLPADFALVMGYRPVVSHGRLLRPDGSCSSPFGPTAYGFGDACRAHDLGYDLLRYADRKGHPLGPWAREAVDDEFDRSLHGRCTGARATASCHAAASVYADAVRLNSVRQGFGVPVTESPTRPLVGLGVGLVVAVLLASGTGALPDARTWPRTGGSRRRATRAPAVGSGAVVAGVPR